MEHPLPTPQVVPERIRGLRRVEFEKLVETGALDDVKCELLEGMVVEKMTAKPPHTGLQMRLHEMLYAAAAEQGMAIRVSMAFAATDDSMPEPDLALVPRGAALSMTSHPEKAFLLVEVCHTSEHNDRVIKTRIYAQAKIAEYWIVDVNEKAIEIYTKPRGKTYGEKRIVTEGIISAVALSEARVDLAALFAP